MALDTRVSVTIDLGPRAPIETVSAAIVRLDTVCQMAGDLQRRLSRARAAEELLSHDVPLRSFRSSARYRLPPNYPFRYPELAGLFEELPPEPELERALLTWQRELNIDNDDTTVVESLRYNNPLELILVVAGGGVVIQLLKLVRDWPARRRIANAAADDIEDQVSARKRVRRFMTDGILEGRLPIQEKWIDAVMTKEPIDALDALLRNDVQVQELDKLDESD